MDRMLPANEVGVDDVLASMASLATQNLVRMAVATARMRFMRQPGQSEDAWKGQLPIAPFDMTFFAQVVAEAFGRHESVRAILDGASVAEATGWDV